MTCWHHVGQVIPAPSRWTGWMFQGTNSRSLSSPWWDFCAQRSSSIVQTGFPIHQLLIHQKNRQIISVIFTFGDDVYVLLTGLSHIRSLVTSLCLSSFITPLTMNYNLNNQKWQPVNWSSVIHDDDHLATSTLTVMKMIDFLKWFYAGGHAAVSVKQQANSEWGRLGEAEEVYWGLWSRRLITTAAAHYSLSFKLCVIWFNLWSKWLKIHHWCMKLPVSPFKILHLRGFVVQLKLLLQVTGENAVLHMQYNFEYCRRTHTSA